MTSLVDRTITEILSNNKKMHSFHNFDNLVHNFKLGQGRINDTTIDLFKFDVHPFKINTTPFNDHIIKETAVNPQPIQKVEKVKPIPLQNYKVDSMKPNIQVENAFKDIVVKNNVKPIVHQNPQKYEYHLDKYDVKDIAMKRLDIQYGYENEFSKVFEDFYENEYLKSFEEIEDIDTNIDVLNAYVPVTKKQETIKKQLLANPNDENLKQYAKKQLKNIPAFKDEKEIEIYKALEKLPDKQILTVPQIQNLNYNFKKDGINIKLPYNTSVEGAKNQMHLVMQKVLNQNSSKFKPYQSVVEKILDSKTKSSDLDDDDEFSFLDDTIDGLLEEFKDKSNEELNAYMDDSTESLLSHIDEGTTTTDSIIELIKELNKLIDSNITEAIGTITAAKLNNVLNDNGTIKYINGHNKMNGLISRRDKLLALITLNGGK